MVKINHPLPRTRRCELLGVARSTSYYRPAPVSVDDLVLMTQIDRIHTSQPFRGSRRIVDALADQGQLVNRKRVRRLMRLMGIQAIHPGPKTSQPHPQHKIYPYLLRNLNIDQANQVWASDITYCAPSLRKLLWKMLSGLEHVWNASRTTLEETNWMPALCYGRA
jgi:putative transposase